MTKGINMTTEEILAEFHLPSNPLKRTTRLKAIITAIEGQRRGLPDGRYRDLLSQKISTMQKMLNEVRPLNERQPLRVSSPESKSSLPLKGKKLPKISTLALQKSKKRGKPTVMVAKGKRTIRTKRF
jgi:hypothetical protein